MQIIGPVGIVIIEAINGTCRIIAALGQRYQRRIGFVKSKGIARPCEKLEKANKKNARL
jgi:hypothetical protein